jgi:hypothetical protein
MDSKRPGYVCNDWLVIVQSGAHDASPLILLPLAVQRISRLGLRSRMNLVARSYTSAGEIV